MNHQLFLLLLILSSFNTASASRPLTGHHRPAAASSSAAAFIVSQPQHQHPYLHLHQRTVRSFHNDVSGSSSSSSYWKLVHSYSSIPRSKSRSGSTLYTSISSAQSQPPPPKLNRIPLPAMLAGGLFLFSSSVPRKQQQFAKQLLTLSEDALRNDPTVGMELGSGLEAGGVFASSFGKVAVTTTTTSSTSSSSTAYNINDDNNIDEQNQSTSTASVEVEQLVLQFQINGGNAWAQGVAYGIRPSSSLGKINGNGNNYKNNSEENEVKLLSLEVANMDAVLNGQAFQLPL